MARYRYTIPPRYHMLNHQHRCRHQAMTITAMDKPGESATQEAEEEYRYRTGIETGLPTGTTRERIDE